MRRAVKGYFFFYKSFFCGGEYRRFLFVNNRSAILQISVYSDIMYCVKLYLREVRRWRDICQLVKRPTSGVCRKAEYISSVNKDAFRALSASADRGSYPQTRKSPPIRGWTGIVDFLGQMKKRKEADNFVDKSSFLYKCGLCGNGEVIVHRESLTLRIKNRDSLPKLEVHTIGC